MSAHHYQFRVRIEDRCFTVQLPVPTQHRALPKFSDLLNVIQDAAEDLDLHEYQISTSFNNYALTNDDTFHHWLIQSNNTTITRDLVLLHRSIIPEQSSLQQQQPPRVVKPTVVRWSGPHRHRHHDAFRKDSGMGLLLLEEQHDNTPCHVVKKQRLNSPTTGASLRLLPEPPKHQQPVAAATRVHPITASTTLPPINPACTHPTALSSCSSPPPTLPALASITTNVIPLYQRSNKPILHPSPSTPSFVCDKRTSAGHQCGQTFRRSYDLQRHQTTHLRNRPYSYCSQCGKKFTRIDALRRHERVQGHRPTAIDTGTRDHPH